jgi:basic membrane protein A and related proteins
MKRKSVVLWVLVTLLVVAGCVSNQPAAAPAADQPTSAPASDQPAAQAPAAPADAKKAMVALLLPGTINDAGWSAAGYNGLMEGQKKYDLDVAYTESVALVDHESTLRDYASRGYGLIICHGDEFSDAVKKVAPDFPNTMFAISNSSTRLPNAVGMDVLNEQGGYLAGYALGLLTKSNKVGFISSTEIYPMKRSESGFKQGLKASNPDAEPVIAYVGSGTDAAKGKETAYAVFDKGVDAVYQYAQGAGIGVIQAAEEKGKPVIVTSPSQREMAPKMAALVLRTAMSANIVAAIDAYVNGKSMEDTQIVGTFGSGLFQVSEINENLFTKEQAQKVRDEVAKLQADQVKVEKLAP